MRKDKIHSCIMLRGVAYFLLFLSAITCADIVVQPMGIIFKTLSMIIFMGLFAPGMWLYMRSSDFYDYWKENDYSVPERLNILEEQAHARTRP